MKRTLSAALALLFALAAFLGALPASVGVYAEDTPSAVDLSTTIHLPPIGNQGQVGCCASMAITYMQFTNAVSRYLHHEDPLIDWNPSSGDPRYCFAPRFTYNLAGAGTAWVYEIIKEQGCPTQEYAPFSGGTTGYAYNNALAKSWAAEPGVWTEARNFRLKNYDQVWIGTECPDYRVTATDAGQALIERIKEALRDGNVVVTGGYPNTWTNENPVVISSRGTYGKAGEHAIAYSTGDQSGGHQVAIIGYDDEITCRKNGVTLKGAFKIANSWGTDWWDGGCLWMMYDAFNGKDQSEYPELNADNRTWTMDQVVFLDWRTDLLIGQTGLCAELTLTDADRDNLEVTLVGTDRSTGSSITYKPYMYSYMRRRPNYQKGFNYVGKTTAPSTGVITVGFDELFDRIPANKTPDDYVWGVRVTGWIRDGSTTLEKIVLKNDGEILCVRPVGDEIDYWTTKLYDLEAEQSGVSGDLFWNLTGGVLTVWGEGAMRDFRDDPSTRPWAGFADEITKVVIEDGVTSIGSAAFSRCGALNEVVCGKDVTKIGFDAFSYDPALETVVFGGPVSEIEQGTVYSSNNLQHVTLTGQTVEDFLEKAALTRYNENYQNAEITVAQPAPTSITADGTWLRGSWTLRDGTLTISGSGAMPNYSDSAPAPWQEYKDEVSKIVVEDGVSSIGARAFTHFTELYSVICGKNVASLGMDAFAYSPVYEIRFFHAIRSIAQGAVYSCDCLAKVGLTDQKKDEFLEIAHRTSYNTDFDNALFVDAATGVQKSSVRVERYGNGMENWANSPNKGNMSAATQILFSPYDWNAAYYMPGLTVTVNMKAVDGSSDDTFTTTVATVHDGGDWGVCRIEPCLMSTPWIPVKGKEYVATFTFVDPEGITAVCRVAQTYKLDEAPCYVGPYDVNGSGALNISDVTYLLDALANGRPVFADPDGDGIVSIRDVTVLLDVLAAK